MRIVFYMIFEIAILVFDVLGAYLQYTAGHYVWAMILSFCTGIVLSSVVYVLITYF